MMRLVLVTGLTERPQDTRSPVQTLPGIER